MALVNYYFDAFFCACMCVGYFLGFRTGIIGSFFYVVSGFLGMMTVNQYGYLFPFSSTAVFFWAVVFFVAVGLMFRRILEVFTMGLLDRFVGAVMGGILVLIVVSNALSLYSNFKAQPNVFTAVTASYSYRYIIKPWQIVSPPFLKARYFKGADYFDSVMQATGLSSRGVIKQINDGEKRMQSLEQDMFAKEESAVKKTPPKTEKE